MVKIEARGEDATGEGERRHEEKLDARRDTNVLVLLSRLLRNSGISTGQQKGRLCHVPPSFPGAPLYFTVCLCTHMPAYVRLDSLKFVALFSDSHSLFDGYLWSKTRSPDETVFAKRKPKQTKQPQVFLRSSCFSIKP